MKKKIDITKVSSTTSKVIGIVGTRRRNTESDFYKVYDLFQELYKPDDTICSGLCPEGGDYFATLIAKKFNLKTLWFPADWEKYGKSAGFIRNTDIARESHILIACVHKDRTGGTEDTIKKFIKFHGNKNLYLV